jgi:hypothetical protein
VYHLLLLLLLLLDPWHAGLGQHLLPTVPH